MQKTAKYCKIIITTNGGETLMSERQQAELLLEHIPDKNLHIVIALMKELTGYDDYIECALDEADYLAEHTEERLTHEEVFSDLRRTIHA